MNLFFGNLIIMKKALFFLSLTLIINAGLISFASLPENQILIRFKEGYKNSDIEKFITTQKFKKLKILSGINIYVFETPSGMKSDEAVKKVEKNGIVKYVESNKHVDISKAFSAPIEKVDYSKMLNKEVTVTGMYEYNRAGAMLSNDNGAISLIDLDNRVLLRLPSAKDGIKIKATGIIRKIKGYNVTNDIGFLPVSVEEVK